MTVNIDQDAAVRMRNAIEVVEEGVPFERIIEDMKYHDLLLVGCDPHFFYGHPKKRTNTLAGVFHNTVGPTIVVPKKHRDVGRVLIATNGENSASRAIRRFVELKPFGEDLVVELLFVHDMEDQADAEFHLQMTKDYLSAHGFKARVHSMSNGSSADLILEKAREMDADLIVAGSKTSRGVKGYGLSKTTQALTDQEEVAVFVEH